MKKIEINLLFLDSSLIKIETFNVVVFTAIKRLPCTYNQLNALDTDNGTDDSNNDTVNNTFTPTDNDYNGWVAAAPK